MSRKFYTLLLPFKPYPAIISRNIAFSAKHFAYLPFSRPQVFSQHLNYYLVHHRHQLSTCSTTDPTPPPHQYSVLFYGSDDFSLDSLRLLHRKLANGSNQPKNEPKVGIKRLEIVTTSENNLVYNYCRKMDLPCHAFGSYSIPSDEFDFGVVSSFGRLIPKQAIEACHHGKRFNLNSMSVIKVNLFSRHSEHSRLLITSMAGRITNSARNSCQ
jgi:hypothetical protein